MTDWDPDRYRRFEAERTRPAFDLLQRVILDAPATVFDLGCGPGNSTELLADRYSLAEIVGIDSSAAMIETARRRLPDLRFERADIAAWEAPSPPDLIFANAVMQWLPDHRTLFPKLFAMLAPRGVLAVQMPDNLAEPSHRLMREVAAEQPWSERLAPATADRSALPALADYYDLLASCGATVEVWRTVYQHPMASPAAIVDWLRATGLRPFLSRLDPADQEAFVARYEERIDVAYPARADGCRLLAFPRVFIVAQRN